MAFALGDEPYITGHPYKGEGTGRCRVVVGGGVLLAGEQPVACGERAAAHVNPGDASAEHPITASPHLFTPQEQDTTLCDYRYDLGGTRVCGYPEQLHHWAAYDKYMAETAGKVGVGEHAFEGREASGFCEREGCGLDPKSPVHERTKRTGDIVRKADVAQYERPPMPDAARKGPVVTLIDAPVDPLGTLAVICGIYTGKVRRSKAEVTDEERRAMLDDMLNTVLSGPLESMQFTFLVEGVSRSITHQMVRNRFSFFAQESLRFAVAEDWAQEVPLPPSLAALPQDAPAVGVWVKAMNQAEDNYAALIGAGMPAEEARGVLPHDITTRLYWTVNLRALLMEAGKRTCTQAQFPWRAIFAGVAKAFRERGDVRTAGPVRSGYDHWQYRAFADLIRPVCYQQGKCGFMANFDRGCTIRNRVDANERLGRPSSEWHTEYDVVDPAEVVVGVGPKSVVVVGGEKEDDTPVFVGAIDPAEWAADPAAARVVDQVPGHDYSAGGHNLFHCQHPDCKADAEAARTAPGE